jgi:hypothetical protein
VVINPRAIENRESYPRHTCGRDPCTSPQTTNLFTKWTLTGCLSARMDRLVFGNICTYYWRMKLQLPITPCFSDAGNRMGFVNSLYLFVFRILYPNKFWKVSNRLNLSGTWSTNTAYGLHGNIQLWDSPRVWLEMFCSHDSNIFRDPGAQLSQLLG